MHELRESPSPRGDQSPTSNQLPQTPLRRRREFEQDLLRLKLSTAESKVELLSQLSQIADLTAAERRQLLLSVERYVLNPRSEVPARITPVLEAILRLTSREHNWSYALKLFRMALETLRKEDVVKQLQEPLEILLKMFLPANSQALFSPELFLRVSRRLEHQNEEDALVELATLGLFFYPFSGPLRELRADYTLIKGDAGRARGDYERLIEQFPDQHDYLLDRAEACFKMEDYEAGLEDIETFLDEYPDDPMALKKHSEALFQLNRNIEALKVLDRLVQLEPTNPELYLQRAKVNENLDYFDEAIKDAEKVLELQPGNPEARQLRHSLMLHRQSYGMEDDIYTAFGRGDEDAVLGDAKIPDVRFSDIGGLDKVKQAIRETIEYPLKYPEISSRYGKRAGGGILFFGPPGCGKTMLARAAAGECQVSFINVNLASVLDKWVGNSEKAVSMIFATARKRAPSIVFLDEVDAIGGSRSSMQSGWEKKLISQLLIELDGLTSDNDKVMVLGATNAPWDVDFALRRPGRLGRLVFVPPPGPTERAEIFKIYLNARPFVSEDIDWSWLAQNSVNYSADAIRQVVENAATIPWRSAIEGGEERAINMADLKSALASTPPDLQEWEKLVRRYNEFDQQTLKRPGIGFRKAGEPSAT